jgi:Arc/MetJ-type ribon-helix-helix transcriptional regulator
MTRTIISMPEDEKRWLDSYGKRHRVSSAEVIRRAIREFRLKKSEKDLAAVLRETAGAWASIKGDTRDHIDALRKEWER